MRSRLVSHPIRQRGVGVQMLCRDRHELDDGLRGGGQRGREGLLVRHHGLRQHHERPEPCQGCLQGVVGGHRHRYRHRRARHWHSGGDQCDLQVDSSHARGAGEAIVDLRAECGQDGKDLRLADTEHRLRHILREFQAPAGPSAWGCHLPRRVQGFGARLVCRGGRGDLVQHARERCHSSCDKPRGDGDREVQALPLRVEAEAPRKVGRALYEPGVRHGRSLRAVAEHSLRHSLVLRRDAGLVRLRLLVHVLHILGGQGGAAPVCDAAARVRHADGAAGVADHALRRARALRLRHLDVWAAVHLPFESPRR
mmetsp:Transcript_58516/g.169401  ORF Transcript_58516/g.169401 Transcript_58516/m.169401 type:complete len:311 (-) Transcript_58516:629-1561(-)